MEYKEGLNSETYLNNNRLQIDQITNHPQRDFIAASIYTLFATALIHRDIKPSNIIIQENTLKYRTD